MDPDTPIPPAEGDPHRRRIESWLSEHLGGTADGVPIAEDTRLLDDVGMDSLQIVELVGFLESEFDVSVPGEALTPRNFETPDAIARLVSDLRSRG